MIKIIKMVLIAVLSVVVLFGLIVFRLFAIKIYDSQVQIRHMKNLVANYNGDYDPIDESQFYNFDINDESIKLNHIQMLASHNSYKGMSSSIGRFFVGLGDSFDEARALKYAYRNLTEQLNRGVRSMEFDVRKRKSSFVLTHVPLVDNSSVAPDFAMALEELSLYSDHNPDHLPIIILMEIKEDWMILDHALQTMDQDVLIELNALIKTKVGDHLFSPSDMIEDGLTLKDTIQTMGWPSVKSLRGKIMFVLHPNNKNDMYEAIDPTLKSLPMFIGSYPDDLDHDYASFIIHNDVNVASIQSLVQQNYIVRTRIDESLMFDQERLIHAIESGAQILSSDFTSGRKDIKTQDIITISGYMIVKRED